MRRAARIAFALTILTATACGPTFTPPDGPATPAPEADAAWAEATATCRAARTYSAMLHLGAAGANIQTAVTADGQIFLGAIVAGQPRFTLAGTRDDATLVLHDDRKVVRAPAGAIVEALIGTAIGPEEWLAFVTGCVTRSHEATESARVGKYIRITTRDGRIYLQREGGTWRVRGGEVLGLIVDYEWQASSLPAMLRARSAPGSSVKTRLSLEAGQFRVNDDVAAALFAPPRAAGAASPMTLAELRDAGPLGRGKE